MGKVRRYRQKYHLSKVKAAKSAADSNTPSVVNTKTNPIGENVFAGLDISVDSLTKSLGPDFDARSVASTKSRKELKQEEQHFKKKVKKRLRHERFLQKLDVTQQAIRAAKGKGNKKQKAADKNQNPPAPSSSSSPFDALPLWNSHLNNNIFKNVDYKPKPKPKGIMKMNKRIRQQTKDAKQMKMIITDKKFRANPGETILDLLRQKVASSG